MATEGQYYRAPFGVGVIIVTIVFSAVMIPVLLISYYRHPVMAVVLVLLLTLYPLALPLGYRLGNSEIIIRRIIWNVQIPYSTITGAESADDRDLEATPFSSIGLRGWFGYRCIIHLKEVGWVSMYTKKTSDLVLITTSQNNYLIAPDSPESFIEDLRSAMHNVYLPLGDGRPDEEGFSEIGDVEETEFAEVVDLD